MPVPINIDAANAIDLGVFPVTIVQDVLDSGITYTVWYKFTAASGVNLAGIFGFGDLVGYKPFINVWTGTPGLLTIWPSPAQATTQNKPIQFPVTVGTVYYLELVANGNFTPSNLTLNGQYLTNTTAPVGSILINDDTDGFGLILLSSTIDYTVLRHVYPFPAGEEGDVLQTTGRYLFTDGFLDLIKLYENDLSFITNVTPPWIEGSLIRSCQGAGKFYIGSPGIGGLTAKIVSVSNTGVLGGTVFDIGASMTNFCVKDDETIVYYTGVGGSLNSNIKRWDMTLNIAMSDLVADVGGNYFITDLLYLSDDTIIACYRSSSAPNDTFVRRYDALTGATLNTYMLGTNTSTVPRLAYAIDNPLSFWILTHPLGTGTSVIKNIRCSDGVVLTTRTSMEFEVGVYQGTETSTPTSRFGNSFSCPLVITRVEIGAVLTGTIIINKIAGGSAQVFQFNAGGGLAPASFQLMDGQNQTYNNVPVGVYSIEEIVPVGWIVGYVVSDGSPISALNLSAGEVIIVNVTNTLLPNEFSGIYKLVPGKRQDTLWTDVDAGTERDVKIPNPFIRTGFIGE